jgi:hypothetical protein
MPAEDGQSDCRDQCGGFRIVLHVQLPAMRFYDRPDPVQAKPVVALAYVPERFASPILRRRIKNSFWFVETE